MLATTPTPCKIQLVDLSRELSPLTVDDPRYRAVGMFFCLHGVPLGHRYLDAAELPLSAAQLWNVAVEAILPALTEYLMRDLRVPPNEDSGLVQRLASLKPLEEFEFLVQVRRARSVSASVSVVICTHERAQSLETCLEVMQKFHNPSIEYIVVDNAPRSDTTRRVVERFPHVHYCVEPRPGLSRARNTGIRSARGEIIVFTDDDVIVTDNWLAELTRSFDDTRVACTTGLVVPAEMETREQSWFEHWLTFNRGYLPLRFDRQWLARYRSVPPVWQIGAGCNMAIRRSAFETAGYFDTRLGAGASGCSEDSELWYRLLAAGHVCEYVPAAMVLHRHRVDAAGLMRQMRMYARGHASALIVQFMRHGGIGHLLRLFFTLPAQCFRKLASSLVFPERRPFWTATIRGHFAGLFYLMRDLRDQSAEGLREPPGLTSIRGEEEKRSREPAGVLSGAGKHVQE